MIDAPKFLKNIEGIAKDKNIEVPHLIFKDDEGEEYISLGFNYLSEEEIEKYLKEESQESSKIKQELPNIITENRFYLKDKKVKQMEFNLNLTYNYGFTGELLKDYIANYKESIQENFYTLTIENLNDINNQLNILNDKNLHGLQIQSSVYPYELDAIYIKHNNSDQRQEKNEQEKEYNVRRGYFEKIDLRGKTKEEVKKIISNLPEGVTVYEHRRGDKVPSGYNGQNFMSLNGERRKMLLDRVEKAQIFIPQSKL